MTGVASIRLPAPPKISRTGRPATVSCRAGAAVRPRRGAADRRNRVCRRRRIRNRTSTRRSRRSKRPPSSSRASWRRTWRRSRGSPTRTTSGAVARENPDADTPPGKTVRRRREPPSDRQRGRGGGSGLERRIPPLVRGRPGVAARPARLTARDGRSVRADDRLPGERRSARGRPGPRGFFATTCELGYECLRPRGLVYRRRPDPSRISEPRRRGPPRRSPVACAGMRWSPRTVRPVHRRRSRR